MQIQEDLWKIPYLADELDAKVGMQNFKQVNMCFMLLIVRITRKIKSETKQKDSLCPALSLKVQLIQKDDLGISATSKCNFNSKLNLLVSESLNENRSLLELSIADYFVLLFVKIPIYQ